MNIARFHGCALAYGRWMVAERRHHQIVDPIWPDGYSFVSRYARDVFGQRKNSLLESLLQRTAAVALSFADPIHGTWLEIGCGPGGFLPTIAARAERVVGADINEPALQDAAVLTRAMCGSVLSVAGSAHSLPFKSDSFDGVLALETLEHCDENRALPEIWRVLAPGGKLVFTVPVEIGTAALVRQLIRSAFHFQDSYWNRMPYRRRDFVQFALLGLDRELHRTMRLPSPSTHLFFSYRKLLKDVNTLFRVERLGRSPFVLPGPWSFSIVVSARKRAVEQGPM